MGEYGCFLSFILISKILTFSVQYDYLETGINIADIRILQFSFEVISYFQANHLIDDKPNVSYFPV